MRVGLVLDASFLLAHLRQEDMSALDAAELVLTVGENGDITGIPVLCVLAIYDQLTNEERERLMVLGTTHDEPAVSFLPLLAQEMVAVAELAKTMQQEQAHAIVEAQRHGAVLATYQPGPAVPLLPPDQLLDMTDLDADLGSGS